MGGIGRNGEDRARNRAEIGVGRNVCMDQDRMVLVVTASGTQSTFLGPTSFIKILLQIGFLTMQAVYNYNILYICHSTSAKKNNLQQWRVYHLRIVL